jgi:hypothetical protein
MQATYNSEIGDIICIYKYVKIIGLKLLQTYLLIQIRDYHGGIEATIFQNATPCTVVYG